MDWGAIDPSHEQEGAATIFTNPHRGEGMTLRARLEYSRPVFDRG